MRPCVRRKPLQDGLNRAFAQSRLLFGHRRFDWNGKLLSRLVAASGRLYLLVVGIGFLICILNQRGRQRTMQVARVSAQKGIERASRIVLMNVISIRIFSHESDTVS